MIVCAGEALIDMLPRETTLGEPAFAPLAGGAVFNTAIALGRLGAPVGFFSGLSTDLFGQILTAGLEASNVDASFAARSDRPTTLAFVTLTDGHAEYAFYDENTAGRLLAPADLPDLPDDTSALFFGGISLVVEPCATAYEALMSRETNARAIMMDPNIRPGFVTDEDAYRARLKRMLGMADIVKVSDEDMAWLLGDDATPKALLDAGAAVVFVTRGAEGPTAYTASGAFACPAPKATVVDTVGAGDTFNAGVLAALSERGLLTKKAVQDLGEDNLMAAMQLGAAAAAVTVSRAGANPPWRREL